MNWNYAACEFALLFPTGFYGLIISYYLSPHYPILSPFRVHNLPGNLEFIFHFFLTALLSNHRDASDWFSTTPHHFPQARNTVSVGPIIWMCSLSVAWFIERQPQLQFLLLFALTKMLKIQNCQDGTVHSLQLKQLTATAPSKKRNKQINKLKKNTALPRTITQSISTKDGKTTRCFPNSERRLPLQFSTLQPLGTLCSLSSGWELRGTHCHGPSNFRSSSQQTGIGGLKNKSAYVLLFPDLVYTQ